MDYQTIERIKIGLKDPSIGPETIAIMLTRLCNLNCIYCRGGRIDKKYIFSTEISDELSTEELFELFEDARSFYVKEINLGGMDGEPFCKKDVLKIMRKIKELGFIGSMTTNGSFLNSDIAKIMKDYEWDILLISLDSINESMQYKIRPAYNNKPYFQNIIQFLETLEKINSKTRILLNVVISKFNYKDLPSLLKFAYSYKNIESINILKMLNMGLINYEMIQLNNKELEEFKSILLRFKDEKKLVYLGNWIELEEKNFKDKSQIFEQEKFNGCFTNYYILSIDSNGDILQCPQYQKVIHGLNIKNKPLRKLWKDEHLQFRQALVEEAICFENCCTILKEQNKLIYKTLFGECV